jgi:hypothetical protein
MSSFWPVIALVLAAAEEEEEEENPSSVLDSALGDP